MQISHRGALGGLAGATTATALGLLLAVTAPAAPSTLTVVATDAIVGQTIQATAQLSESPDASGEISFEVFGPDDPTCSGPALTPAPASASVTGEGQYVSGEISPPAAGGYHWSAHYSGDLENPSADSTCSAISTVGKASPGLTANASAGTVGTAIHDEATVTGGFSPSGEVTFSVYGPADATCSTPLETTAVTIQGGHATSADFLAQQAGEFRWTAAYAGDANNESIGTVCGEASQASTVGKAAPTLGGVATAAVSVGQTITDSASLAAGFEPSGQLVFRAYGPGDPTCASAPAYEKAVALSGNGSYAPAGFAPGPGLYRWTVEYAGDANNEPVGTSCGEAGQTSTVSKAAPTLAGVATSAQVGQTITDSATLTGGFAASGQLLFRAYGPGDATCASTPAYEETVAVSGDGSYSPAGFAPGPGLYRWTATYEGDANNESVGTVCGEASQASTVSKAAPTLGGVATAAVSVGQTITDSASLAAGFEPSGQLVFRAYGPGDPTCASAPAYEKAVALSGNGSYAPAGFAPGPGLYRWTVEYAGDANNEPVGTSCGEAGQTSTVSKAAPTLAGVATSAQVGQAITDNATLTGGFAASGQLLFRAYGPGDATCASTPAYEETVAVSGDGSYSPSGFAPGPGLYRWTATYEGDANNESVGSVCGDASQSSAVGTIDVTMAVSATGGTVGSPVSATATIQEGAIPTGQITFKAFSPGDTTCSGAAAFSSTVSVSGNGPYRSEAFVPPRVGAFRWTVGYSGNANHAPTTAGCGKATSSVVRARPSIAGAVTQRIAVGISFLDTATLNGGYAPSGTITFQIYGPVAAGCAKPLFVDTVAVAGNGTFSSDPFVALRPGRYSFVASYSGDAANQGAAEPCDSAGQVVQVQKRTPKVKPRALLIGGKRISIRAHLSGGASPSGAITFRLYGPGDKRCRRKPTFSGGVTVKSNGNFSLAQYLATKPGVYRLGVGYSGDQRNQRYKIACNGAQPIRVG